MFLINEELVLTCNMTGTVTDLNTTS